MDITRWLDTTVREQPDTPAPASLSNRPPPTLPVLLHEEAPGTRLPPGSVPHQPSLLGALLGAASATERQRIVRAQLRLLGFERLGYGRLMQLGDSLTPLSFCLTYADRRWAERYFAQAYQEIDPRLPPALRSSLPVAWSLDALTAQVSAGRHGVRQRRFFADLAATGMRSGVVFALPATAGGQRELLSLLSRAPDTRWMGDALIGEVLTLSLCLHEVYSREQRRPAAPEQPPAPTALSAVHRHILNCISQGLGDKEIAARLGCTLHNVDYHLRQLRRRFGVRNRVQLMHAAQELMQG